MRVAERCGRASCSSPFTYSFFRSRATRADSALRCMRCVSFCSFDRLGFPPRKSSSSPSSSSSAAARAARDPPVVADGPTSGGGSGGIAGGRGMPLRGFTLGLSHPGCATAFSPAAHRKHERRSSSTKSYGITDCVRTPLAPRAVVVAAWRTTAPLPELCSGPLRAALEATQIPQPEGLLSAAPRDASAIFFPKNKKFRDHGGPNRARGVQRLMCPSQFRPFMNFPPFRPSRDSCAHHSSPRTGGGVGGPYPGRLTHPETSPQDVAGCGDASGRCIGAGSQPGAGREAGALGRSLTAMFKQRCSNRSGSPGLAPGWG